MLKLLLSTFYRNKTKCGPTLTANININYSRHLFLNFIISREYRWRLQTFLSCIVRANNYVWGLIIGSTKLTLLLYHRPLVDRRFFVWKISDMVVLQSWFFRIHCMVQYDWNQIRFSSLTLTCGIPVQISFVRLNTDKDYKCLTKSQGEEISFVLKPTVENTNIFLQFKILQPGMFFAPCHSIHF